MARLIQGLGGPTPIPRNTDPLTDLTRLLDRLQQTILRADAERERRFRTSEFERAKASNNIGVAQSLLAKLGQDALSIKVHTRRQELQADLTRKRTVLEQLTERMRDLEELALAEDEDEEMSYDDDDDDDNNNIPVAQATGEGAGPGTGHGRQYGRFLRAEQEELYESLARMASNLKASSKAFATTLEEDKDVINRAAEGLNKNEQGLDAASRRMGTLRRMTEGKGWWGRMLLYAWVYGLMVVLVLVVFVMPKLRFSTW
ncbi:hypothetical protein P8C59_006825 [Phyllachora maydis]|uniref:Synaptobrevin n=1 Tax=Phyllachora maydis TaxID=1825666 RepID=A0AAD9I786_9PEZI|nr:hypothetical protein P8C59_006825 [Phyllachora maydis]